jgi:hypothetical protein
VNGIIRHHRLAFTRRRFQLRSDVPVKLVRDPVDERRGAVLEVGAAVGV